MGILRITVRVPLGLWFSLGLVLGLGLVFGLGLVLGLGFRTYFTQVAKVVT